MGAITAWINNTSQAKKALNERRREILEGVTDTVDASFGAGAHFCAQLRNALHERSKQGHLSANEIQTLEDVEASFYSSFRLHSSCSAKLLLLGETEAEQHLRTLNSHLDRLFKEGNIHSDKCSDENLEEHKGRITASRKAFFNELSKAYIRNV